LIGVDTLGKDACTCCHACVAVCRVGCIEIVADDDGFEYPAIDSSRCMKCNECYSVCQKSVPITANNGTTAYAAKAKSNGVRAASSSGGIFSLLASCVLQKGGCVYGAAIGHNAVVEHVRAADEETLCRLRGSKYVQSRVGLVYQHVLEDLALKRWVLFSGTPCQIGGLRKYLGHKGIDGKKLICQDVICLGVPPYKAWRKYLDDLNFHGDITVNFRDKRKGWTKPSLLISDGKRTYIRRNRYNAYSMAFLSGIMHRPSCYMCGYRDMRYQSDITLADFWGIHEVLPDFADECGVSLIMSHTRKGEDFFGFIGGEMEAVKVPLEKALHGNKRAATGMEPHPDRDAFLFEIRTGRFSKAVVKYVKGGWLKWIANAGRRILRNSRN